MLWDVKTELNVAEPTSKEVHDAGRKSESPKVKVKAK